MTSDPEFTIGIEEEYLLVDRDSFKLADATEGLIAECLNELEGQVSPEFLRCQIEVGTRVCQTIGEAREDLKRLRACVARHARAHGLAPIAVSCHPFADWKQQPHTDKERYNDLQRDLAGVARRMLICGMHVHVGIADQDQRIDLMNQFAYFLPHLLALSCSSPYWQGEDTGLSSYRLTIFDNLPRTGQPPRMSSWAEYERSVNVLIDLGIIEDTSKIWWDLRPSSRFPTLESRICDVTPRLEHTLTLAALTQASMRLLWRLAKKNQRWRIYDSFLVGENRWRALRYGTTEGMIDFGERRILPFQEIADQWLELIGEDAGILRSVAEVERVQDILKDGTSTQRQRRVYDEAAASGLDHEDALRKVVAHLIDEFEADL
ncbi:carboxylate-amine ligase [Ovoidimarina sediminis]|uniref:carboxylate-amine ligase n=1 Tax=Ovoidimarina sediminis TaxID=3079856 RepID=UPI0029067511|nr:carboxylate-amine ligase [Rhodophyticola sp. MJ-SS7]MDU8942234.1 carboxylate-amine ligase [Rhodophyticola sp. MJ-SS7]